PPRRARRARHERGEPVIHAYCITERTPTAPPERRGLGGARLRAAEAGGLRVVYSRHRTLQFDPSPALVLTHERVVEAVMAEAPVLPLRYGTVLADVEQLRTAIGQRSGEFRRALERVRGHVELGVRLVRASGTPRPGARAGEVSGREF